MVLRPREPLAAAPLLERLAALGLHHVEIAWQSGPHWSGQCRELLASFPRLLLGAASVCDAGALAAVREAGLPYAVSPILRRPLLEGAAEAGITLVPGVMTPTEVHRALRWDCRMVKLFPAAVLGIGYWASLRGPLGGALPFCIAAGGLATADVIPWLAAGVDAVALGSALLRRTAGGPGDGEGPEAFDGAPLAALLAELTVRGR